MAAAAKGVPGLSVLDGWWIEGDREGVTGGSIGDRVEPSRGWMPVTQQHSIENWKRRSSLFR